MHVAFQQSGHPKQMNIGPREFWRSQMIAPCEPNGKGKCRDFCRVPTASPPMGPEKANYKTGQTAVVLNRH
jgi:hypothetical protein